MPHQLATPSVYWSQLSGLWRFEAFPYDFMASSWNGFRAVCYTMMMLFCLLQTAANSFSFIIIVTFLSPSFVCVCVMCRHKWSCAASNPGFSRSTACSIYADPSGCQLRLRHSMVCWLCSCLAGPRERNGQLGQLSYQLWDWWGQTIHFARPIFLSCIL